MNYLHKKGIIHGDIKAANVLLSEDLHAQVCDFGLSRSVDTATATLMTGKGSIRWMSPELLDNGGGKTFHSDMWAAGMMIYEVSLMLLISRLSTDVVYLDSEWVHPFQNAHVGCSHHNRSPHQAPASRYATYPQPDRRIIRNRLVHRIGLLEV